MPEHFFTDIYGTLIGSPCSTPDELLACRCSPEIALINKAFGNLYMNGIVPCIITNGSPDRSSGLGINLPDESIVVSLNGCHIARRSGEILKTLDFGDKTIIDTLKIVENLGQEPFLLFGCFTDDYTKRILYTNLNSGDATVLFGAGDILNDPTTIIVDSTEQLSNLLPSIISLRLRTQHGITIDYPHEQRGRYIQTRLSKVSKSTAMEYLISAGLVSRFWFCGDSLPDVNVITDPKFTHNVIGGVIVGKERDFEIPQSIITFPSPSDFVRELNRIVF
jgi:hydroxymethylpyrimidine pyrophosphatase-like HAD family hydrolase